MTTTTPAVSTAEASLSASLADARRELDGIAYRSIPSAPRAVAAALTSLEALTPALLPHARALAARLDETQSPALHELIERTKNRAASRPRADLAYEHLLVLVSQLQDLLRTLERAHGIPYRRAQAASARRRRNRGTSQGAQTDRKGEPSPRPQAIRQRSPLMALGSDVSLRQLTAYPSSARIHDCLRGGKDHYIVDAAFAEQLVAAAPFLPAAVAINDAFATRSADFLSRHLRITQFIDLGCGLPTYPPLHETAARAHPLSAGITLVYIDHDPIVMAHAATLLTAPAPHCIIHVHADLARPESIMTAPDLLSTVDLSQPVAVLAHAVLHELPDHIAYPALSALTSRLPPGSALSITHPTADLHPGHMDKAAALYTEAIGPIALRSRAEVARFADGWHLLDPGVTETALWHTGPAPTYPAGSSAAFAAVAVKA
ncbi:SAM-dependent methyltransferase [Streptomyces sp. NPDC002643]